MIHMQFDWLPPTSNHAYADILVKVKGKLRPKRVLTTEGKKFKRETAAELVREYPVELMIFEPNIPYAVIGQFHFSNLYNKGWPEKAKTRYKTLDADNRLKLFIDALKTAAGIDDSDFLDVRAQKVEGPDITHIWAWNTERECPTDLR